MMLDYVDLHVTSRSAKDGNDLSYLEDDDSCLTTGNEADNLTENSNGWDNTLKHKSKPRAELSCHHASNK